MSILVVTRNFPPLQGGMERLIKHVALALSLEHPVTLCAPIGATRHFADARQIREVPHKPLWLFLFSSFINACLLAYHHRPKAVLGGSGLAGPTTRIIASLNSCPAIVYLHGLDIVVDNLVYRALFLPFIRRCDLLLVNSESTRQLAIKAGIPESRLSILHPGANMPAQIGTEERAELEARFRSEFNCRTGPILLSVGRLTQRKGLSEFIRNCMPEIVGAHPGCHLIVIGDSPKNALLADGFSQREESEKACKELALNDNVSFLGEVSEETLNAAYQCADALIFPVVERPGDIEGFGMVAIEAAAYGTPTIAFSVGGVPDAVSDKVSGRLMAPGDYPAMTRAVLDVLNRVAVYPQCMEFAKTFSWDAFAVKLNRMVTQAIAAKIK